MDAKQTSRGRRLPEGVRDRHSRGCPALDATGRCSCSAGFEAQVWDPRRKKRIRSTHATEKEARAWRVEALSALKRGSLRERSKTTVAEAAEQLLAGMRDGSIRCRGSQAAYHPSTIRLYERALRLRALDELGGLAVTDVQRRDVQRLVDRLNADGLKPATVANCVDALRRVFATQVRADVISASPCAGLELRPRDGRREHVVEPAESAKLIAAVPPADRALWAVALYAGLRRGELRALRVSDVDFDARVIRVRRTWDDVAGMQLGGKTAAATRDAPIFGALSTILREHLLLTGKRGDDLLLGRTSELPFTPAAVGARADAAWARARLERLTLHEARHSAVSFMCASGADAASIMAWIGHVDERMLAHYRHALKARTARAFEDADALLAQAGAS